MSTDTSFSIVRSFKSFFIGTFFSRISGLLRDILMAFFFGTSPHIAAFMVAYRFANLFRRLLGEASFQAGFVPHYENLRLEDKKKASIFYRDLFFSITFLLATIILLTEMFLFSSSSLFKNNETINLTKIMLVGLVFICLYALNSSFLQCHQSYFLPSVAPAIFNVVWIGCAIFFRNVETEKFIFILAFFIVVAFFFQYLTTAFSSFRIVRQDLNLKELIKFKLFTKDIKKLVKPILLSIIGISAVQINSALDAVFATLAEKEGPAYLWYAIRLYQLPLALFAIAISSAILPPLSRAFKLDDFLNFKRFFSFGMAKSFAFMLPSSIALIILGPSIINLIFARGAFDTFALINTNNCLFGYAIGLCFATFVMIISTAFYAKKEYFIPTVAAIISVIANIFLNLIFIYYFHLKSTSIAIATSFSAILNFAILSFFLKKRIKDIFSKNLIYSCVNTFFCTAFAAFVTIFIGYLLQDPTINFLLNKKFVFPKIFLDKALSFFKISSIYVITLFVSAYFLKNKEILEIVAKYRKPTL